MEETTNKIYVRLDVNNTVIKIFSSVFEQPIETDILLEEGNEEYHAHVHLKYKLTDDSGRLNYKYGEAEENVIEIIDGEEIPKTITVNKLVELMDEEKAELFPATITIISEVVDEEMVMLMEAYLEQSDQIALLKQAIINLGGSI